MIEEQDITEIFERFQDDNSNPKTELIACNEYTFCLAVLLSAQTTDKAVNKATLSLFEIANTPEKMLSIGIDVLKSHIKTLGLYNNKAKNIMLLSEKLIKEFNSEIPKSRDLLETLPGIGRKSANVIMNSLFNGEDCIAVDTHVIRLSNRLGLTKSKDPIDIEKDLIRLVPKKFHKNVSNWLVLHGRYICTAKNPKCNDCFLYDLCDYAKNL